MRPDLFAGWVDQRRNHSHGGAMAFVINANARPYVSPCAHAASNWAADMFSVWASMVGSSVLGQQSLTHVAASRTDSVTKVTDYAP